MWDMSITMIRKSFMSVIQLRILADLRKSANLSWATPEPAFFEVIVRGLALQDHQDMTEVYWITLKLSYFPGQHIYRYKKNTIISKTSIHHSRHQAIPIQSTISCCVFCKPITPWACFLVWFLLQLLVVHWREATATSRPWLIFFGKRVLQKMTVRYRYGRQGVLCLYCVCAYKYLYRYIYIYI